LVGAYLVLLAIDYLPLLIYGVAIDRAHNAKEVIAAELGSPGSYRRKYGVQQSLVLVPFAMPILALAQEAKKGVRGKPTTT
jgi:hypothetical protein